jgi:SEC-C motif
MEDRVREPLTVERVEELEQPCSAHDAQAHARLAEQMAAWAAEPHPDDELAPGQLLVRAAEHYGMADDPARALPLLRRAVETGDRVAPDVRCYLVNGLLAAGEADEAERVAALIRHERPADPDVYLFLGEAFELHGHLADAARWFTSGVLRALRNDDASPLDAVLLMQARRRARLAMGCPEDDYDMLASEAFTAALEEDALDEPLAHEEPVQATTPRRAACPCGSGKRFGACCGHRRRSGRGYAVPLRTA